MVLFHNPTSCERARSRQDNVQFSDSCGRADFSCTLTPVALSGQRSAARPLRLRAAAGQVAKEPLGPPGRRRETDDLRGVLGSCSTQFIQRDGGVPRRNAGRVATYLPRCFHVRCTPA